MINDIPAVPEKRQTKLNLDVPSSLYLADMSHDPIAAIRPRSDSMDGVGNGSDKTMTNTKNIEIPKDQPGVERTLPEGQNDPKSVTNLPAYNLFHITTNAIKIVAGAIMGMVIGIIIGLIVGGVVGAVCGGISGAFFGAGIKPASSALKENSHLLSNMGIWKVIDRKREPFVKNMDFTLNVDMS